MREIFGILFYRASFSIMDFDERENIFLLFKNCKKNSVPY